MRQKLLDGRAPMAIIPPSLLDNQGIIRRSLQLISHVPFPPAGCWKTITY